MNFVQIFHIRCRSQPNFYVFSYDKISLKFCASFRFFIAVFVEKFQKIRYLSYVRRGVGMIPMSVVSNIEIYLSHTLYVISKCPIPMLFQITTNWSLGLNIKFALILDISS